MVVLSLAAAFLAGVFLGVPLGVPVSALALFALATALLTALLVSVRRTPLPALILLLVVLGTLRVEAFGADPGTALAAYHERGPMRVEGVVAAGPEPAGSATRFRFSVDRIEADGVSTEQSGDVLVTLRASAELARRRDAPYFRYGDRLLLEGGLEAPPVLEEFDYPAFLARQGISSVMSFPEATLLGQGEGTAFYRWLHGARRRFADSLARVVPEPQASVGQALLLGMRKDLPEELVEKFRATGTSHLLAISGLHVSVLLGLGLAASAWAFGRRRQLYLIAPLALMWLYALIAGMSPSVARAAIMGSVYLAALALGRPRSVLPALGLAAAVMVAVEPDILWSVSFQLSFTAMAGIAIMAEPLGRRLQALLGDRPQEGTPHSSLRALAAMAVAMTIAATVATLPLAAFYFERLSLVGLPATLLALPALPPALMSQAAAGAVGLLSTVPAQPLGWLAWVITAYITGVVGLFARLPGASFETGPVAPLLVWAYYLLLLLWYGGGTLRSTATRALAHLRASPPGLPLSRVAVPWWVLFTAVSTAALVWIAALSMPDGRLHVTFADVGQGDAVLITTPSGKNIMVDGGPDPLEAARLLGARLPFWDRSLDLVVLTHPHSDHLAGLTEALRRYDVERILEREVQYDTPEYLAWRQAVNAEGAVVIQARPGLILAMDDGVFIQVLGPPEVLMVGTASDVDNASVVLRLVYGDVSFLLTGDIFSEAETALVAGGAPIDSDVLKVAHHGSRGSSTAEFLDAVSPASAVISVGEGNGFGHPHTQTIEALLSHLPEDKIFLTSDSGDIEFVTDGSRLRVKTER
jgi:competence protein ComEC